MILKSKIRTSYIILFLNMVITSNTLLILGKAKFHITPLGVFCKGIKLVMGLLGTETGACEHKGQNSFSGLHPAHGRAN